MTKVVCVCSFSVGLDEMTRRAQRDHMAVLRVLSERKRFSVFEASHNQDIARTVTDLFDLGLVRGVGGAFPWTHVEITEAGAVALAATRGREGEPRRERR